MKDQQMQSNIQTELTDSCPICESKGENIFLDCKDYNYGISGDWNINQCNNCHSYWLNPRPKKEFIPSLYANNYFTHSIPQSLLEEPKGFVNKLKFGIKIAILEKKFGYQNLSRLTSLPWMINLGNFLGIFPFLSKPVGYMIRYIPYKSGGKLLEVGIGNGQYLLLMQELGWEVEGIEPDTQASKIAQEMGFKIQSCGVEDAQLSSNYYDAIVLHHVTEHLPDPKTTLLKLISCLRVNGTLMTISPNPNSFCSLIFKKNWYGLADIPRHLVLPTPKGYEYMFLDPSLKTKIGTTMQIGYWMYRESLSIKKTDCVGKQNDSIWLKLISFCLKILLFINPERGEEVICAVTKQR